MIVLDSPLFFYCISSLMNIQKLGGGRTKAMISRYSHPSLSYMRESLEKLDKVPLILPLGEKSDALINIDNVDKQR